MSWLERLSLRERILLFTALTLGGAAATWLFLIEPLQQNKARIANDLRTAQMLRAWLTEQLSTHADLLQSLEQANATSAAAPPDSLAALEESLRGSAIAGDLSRMAPQPGDKVQISFDQVSFTALFDWLRVSGLDERVSQISLFAGDLPDQVEARMTLSLGGSE